MNMNIYIVIGTGTETGKDTVTGTEPGTVKVGKIKETVTDT